jgi:hypothetical protein
MFIMFQLDITLSFFISHYHFSFPGFHSLPKTGSVTAIYELLDSTTEYSTRLPSVQVTN